MKIKRQVAVYVVLLLIVFVVLLSVGQSRQIAQPPGSVMLAWDPSPSEKACPAEFGYNLYRGEKSNNYSPEPVNKGLIKEPTYTDTSVITGKTYYYVVKAKCGSTESEPSNEMKVDVRDKKEKK